MSKIDFNDNATFGSPDLQVFNDGKAGIIGPVNLRIEAKGENSDPKGPDFKLIASDENGEINEGFWYQDDPTSSAFLKYQAPKLRNLVFGIFGKDYKWKVQFANPQEALLETMKLVAPALKNKKFTVAVTFGTTGRPSRYLQFKAFGSFVEPYVEGKTELKFSGTDVTERPALATKVEMTDSAEIKAEMDSKTEVSSEKGNDLPF